MLLSVPPTSSAVEHAEYYLENSKAPRTNPASISWKDILDDEPFEGQHWEGVYGLPPGSTVEGWETRSLDSTPPYSPLPLDDLRDLSPSLSSIESLPAVEVKPSLTRDADSPSVIPVSTFGHRQLIEDLQRRQYWRTEWKTDASLMSSFAIKNASSLGTLYFRGILRSLLSFCFVGPLVDRILGERDSSKLGIPQRVVSKSSSSIRLLVLTSL